MSTCRPGVCWDGICRHDKPFDRLAFEGAVEMPSQIRMIQGVGSVVLLGLGSSILLADLRVPASPRFLSSQSLSGTILDLSVSQGLAAAVVRPAGTPSPEIHLVDLSRPRYPRVSIVATLDDMHASTIEGTLLLAVSPEGLHVVDVSIPSEPTTLSRLEIGCPSPVDVAASGTQAAVACGDAGVVVADLADPHAPRLEHAIGTVQARTVSGVEGRWLATADPGPSRLIIEDEGEWRIETIDERGVLDFDGSLLVTDRGLVELDSGRKIELGDEVSAADLEAGRLYGIVGQGGDRRLIIHRASDDPMSQPLASMTLEPFSDLADAAFRGRRAVLAGSSGGILVVDAANPDLPRVDHSFIHDSDIVAVAWTGSDEIAVAGSSGSIDFLDFSVPSSPPRTRSIDVHAADVASTGPALLAAGVDGRLHVILHQGLAQPRLESSLELAGPASIESLSEGLVLVGTESGCQSVPLVMGLPAGTVLGPWSQVGAPCATDGSHLVESGPELRVQRLEGGAPVAGTHSLESVRPRALMHHEGRFWSWGSGGLRVVSIGPDGSAELVQAAPPVTPEGAVRSLEGYRGGVALVTDQSVLFAESSLAPVPVISHLSVTPDARAFALGRGGVPVLGGPGRVWIPGRGGVEVQGDVGSLDSWQDGLIASLGLQGVAVLGLEQDALSLVSMLDVQGEAVRTAPVADATCVAARGGGLVVVDLSDPASPSITGRYGEGDDVEHVVSSGLVCLGLKEGGEILTIGVVDPRTPRLLGTLAAEDAILGHAIWGAGENLVVAQGRRLSFVELADPPLASIRHSFRTDLPATWLVEEGGLAVVVEEGTWFIDLTGEEPKVRGCISTLWNPEALALDGDRLLGLGPTGLWTLDLACLR